MDKDSHDDEWQVRIQFDKYVKKAISRRKLDYYRREADICEKEKSFDDLTATELNQLSVTDHYCWEYTLFEIPGYVIRVQNERLAKALQSLTEDNRNIILMSYYLGYSDAEIALIMNTGKSNICARRNRSLKKMKTKPEARRDERT